MRRIHSAGINVAIKRTLQLEKVRINRQKMIIQNSETAEITTPLVLLFVLLAAIMLGMVNRETKVVKNSPICPCFSSDKKVYSQVNAEYYASYASQRSTIVKLKTLPSEQHILINNY